MSGALMFVGIIMMIIGMGGLLFSLAGVIGAIAKEDWRPGVWQAIASFFVGFLLLGALGAAMVSWA